MFGCGVLDINVKHSQDGVTPLHLACRYNSGDVTQYLLSRQADVNVSDVKGRTPLHYATRRGNDLVTKVSSAVPSPEFCSRGGAWARGARVPKFVVTKSSRSESHLALGLQKRIWLKF